MAGALTGKTVAFITANEGVEQAELTGPWDAVNAAGATPVLVAPSAGKVQAFNHLDPADTFAVDKVTGEVSVDDFDALVLPGGVANADQLRTTQRPSTWSASSSGPVARLPRSATRCGRSSRRSRSTVER